jgi:hypothetical protein
MLYVCSCQDIGSNGVSGQCHFAFFWTSSMEGAGE